MPSKRPSTAYVTSRSPPPRWVCYDAKRFSVKLGDEVWKTLQGRAYTSPIWYDPE